MAYSDKVLDHYTNPRNVGSLDKNSAEVGTGLVGAPECGDVMKLQIKVNPRPTSSKTPSSRRSAAARRLRRLRWPPSGSRARRIDEALGIRNTDIVKELSLPPVKIHCSVLAEDAIRAAIGDWKKKNAAALAQPDAKAEEQRA